MANTKEPEDILASPQDVSLVEMQKQALRLQIQRDSKVILEEEAAEAQKKRVQEQLRVSIAKAHKEKEDNQTACEHRKPNGQSAIAGQRDHSHNYIFLCQYCQKQYDGKTIPSHLRIDTQFVGGPD